MNNLSRVFKKRGLMPPHFDGDELESLTQKKRHGHAAAKAKAWACSSQGQGMGMQQPRLRQPPMGTQQPRHGHAAAKAKVAPRGHVTAKA